MNRIIIFQMVLFALLIVGSLLGSIGWERVGQVFLVVGIIDLILSIAAWRGWPILRGDISNNAALSKRDYGEATRDKYSVDDDHPSAGFLMRITGVGILTCGVGVILLVY